MSIRIKSQRTHRTVVKKTSGFLSIHFFFNCQAKSNQIWGSPSKGDQIENWVNLKKVDGWNSIAKKKHAHKKILIYVRTFRDSKVRVHRISKLVQFLLLKDLFLNLVSIQEVLTHCRGFSNVFAVGFSVEIFQVEPHWKTSWWYFGTQRPLWLACFSAAQTCWDLRWRSVTWESTVWKMGVPFFVFI